MQTGIHRPISGVTRVVTQALLAGAFVLTLSAGNAALAQDAPRADVATIASGADAAPTADQPRRARDRRRAAEADDETRAPEAAPVAETLPSFAPATTSATQPAEVVEATLVCKNRKVTGTKISRRICGTPEQWAAQEKKTTDDAQEAMRQVRERSSIVVTQPSQQAPTGLGGAN
jgi:hypothetical protein